MTNRLALAALCALVLLGVSNASLADDRYANTAAVAREEAKAALESAGAFSVTTAVIVDGKIVQAEAYGAIGGDRAGRPDVRTQFNAGSVSKVFTAVAILRLRDLGLVDLDRPVVHYLPQFRMNDSRYRRITVRMLLDHTAGLGGTNYYHLFASNENPAYVEQTLAALAESTLKADPGDVNVYCNDCFTIAQAIVEQLSGMSLAEFVQQEIFAKAGMIDSSYGFKPGNANVAATYAAGARGAMEPREVVSAKGTGGLTTTAVDLCRFLQALMTGELLSPHSLKALRQPQPGRIGSGYSLARAGLGWDTVAEPTFAIRDITVLGKDGFTTVFRSQMFVAPKQNVAVAAILAGPASLPGDVVIGISQRLMSAALKDSGRASHVETGVPTLRLAASIPESLMQFAGIYGGMGHSIIKLSFDPAANALDTAKLVDGQFVRGASLQYRSDGRFYGPDNTTYSLAHGKNGANLLRQHGATDGDTVTVAQGVRRARMDTSEFNGVTWVPRNLRATDFVTLLYHGLYRTGTIDAVPGIIYLHDGNPGSATPYGLVDKHRTKMILQYEADLVDLEIVQRHGRKVLRAGAFEFGDAATVAPLQPGERVVIAADGLNVARKVVTGGRFTGAVPAEGRIVIYAPSGEIAFDSLFDGTPDVAVSPGSIVLFVGDPQSSFAAELS